ncbi:MAG TPA: UDP-N-acetylglucosamine--N-acetylmuramyl-(pentapeptide) pyrophosphoryl-undecaprenol N-acetylglucosamine transferase [Longimicrobiaceae bacterium]|nr:UDP-N-acetylglucosamine--N-acetylmuramyl-(pentapeptide) pyrophosphoryl-undecaprenol N-acetylglucosamine transferase [Longimicrobiaceae bacterium]
MSGEAPRVLFAGGGTGGHLYPALALGEAFRRLDPRAEVRYVGARRGVEARVLPERGVEHLLLPLEPLRRARPWENWRLIPSMARSFAGLAKLFRAFRPHLVVGTGGYASGPAVAYALLRGVPAAVQEQNSYPGFVTRRVAGRVRQLHLAFPEARRHLKPGKRTEVFEFGNPIAPPDPSITVPEGRERFGLGGGVVCLVTGGSQGARPVNEALLADLRGVGEGRLPPPPEGFELLWATGPAHHDGVAARLAELGAPAWVKALPYIRDMPHALAAADFAVARAGAMSLAELCAWGRPPILVPLPHAAADHQRHNAVALVEAGAALMVTEDELSPGRLWGEVRGLAESAERRQALAQRARERGRPDAADRIVAELARLVRSG